MSKRCPPELLQPTSAKRTHIETSLMVKYDKTNMYINQLVQAFQAVGMTMDLDLLATILVNIFIEAPTEARMKTIYRREECMKLITDNSEVMNKLQHAISDRDHDYRDIMFLPILQRKEDEQKSGAASSSDNQDASFKAFRTPYKPGFSKALLTIMDNYHKKEGYNQVVSIVQSSGTGKSRGVEEAAHTRFTFLFNLARDIENSTYPPPDKLVIDYFSFGLGFLTDAEI
ncbi:hypothetical protein PAXINDRAFT_12576 [Paxillus involutus ATCC 200175]|uniref:Uncharacterized protein n=1 Tax=Paxillus involutus ATCC 200175 TaxID=664439 RepID=A0A0C9TWV9_PAXIN|nr:hypothetical protein PAXINDRAFT_12576 [Paxillus involutus ATCC 200175]